MLKRYVDYKIKTKEFEEHLEQLVSELKGKKVLVCGNADGFKYLNKIYHFDKLFDITAFVYTDSKKQNISGIKTINSKRISDEKFDYILITQENNPEAIANILLEEVYSDNLNIRILFEEDIKDTAYNLDFLFQYKFDKRLKYLSEKLKDKKVIFYGSGLFFDLINKHYDLSVLNSIGVVDKYKSQLYKGGEICGYKLYSPEEITKLNPDYVILSTRRVITVTEDLYYNYLKGSKIKIMPLVKRSLIRTIIEG